jgi:hypothetical protein
LLAPLRSLALAGQADGGAAEAWEALQAPLCLDAGAVVRRLSDACARLPPRGARQLHRAFCSLAESAERLHLRILDRPGSAREAPLAAALRLPFLALTSFFAATRGVFFSADGARTAQGGLSAGAAAGGVFSALSRLDAVRTTHGCPLPPGYADALQRAALALSGSGEGAEALLRDPPVPLLARDARAEAVDARAAFLLRALPFTLTAEADALNGACEPPPPPMLAAAVELSLSFSAPPTAPPAVSASHAALHSALLLCGRARRGWRTETAFRLCDRLLSAPALHSLPPRALPRAVAAALRSVPPGDVRGGALVSRLAARAAHAQGGEEAAALRGALFSALPLLREPQLADALEASRRLVRALPGGERQAAVGMLCAALGPATAVDGPRKRGAVDWCLRLAASL